MLSKCYHEKLLASYILFVSHVKHFEQDVYFNVMIIERKINELQLDFTPNINVSPDLVY
jgi:hypothetical protein